MDNGYFQEMSLNWQAHVDVLVILSHGNDWLGHGSVSTDGFHAYCGHPDSQTPPTEWRLGGDRILAESRALCIGKPMYLVDSKSAIRNRIDS